MEEDFSVAYDLEYTEDEKKDWRENEKSYHIFLCFLVLFLWGFRLMCMSK